MKCVYEDAIREAIISYTKKLIKKKMVQQSQLQI